MLGRFAVGGDRQLTVENTAAEGGARESERTDERERAESCGRSGDVGGQ